MLTQLSETSRIPKSRSSYGPSENIGGEIETVLDR